MQYGTSLSLILAFLIGAVPFGWIIAKLWGVDDLRNVGSSNVGATNVVRTAGKVPGALTFLLDFLKGVLPVVYLPGPSVWIALAAVAGHCYSPFLSFRGGKGVSTTLGAMVAINPWLGAVSVLAYVAGLGLSKVSAIGSLFAMLTILTGTFLFADGTAPRIAVGLIVAIVLVRHKSNWNRLLNTLLIAVAAITQFVSDSSTAYANEIVLRDFRGKIVRLENKPKRVAALMPNLAETVVDLGAGELLIAAPEYARLPDKLKSRVKTLGPYTRISAESVYALKPDLVLASMDGNAPTLVNQLETLGIRVVTINTQSLQDILRTTSLIAQSVGAPDHEKVKTLQKTLTPGNSTERQKGPRVFLQVGWEPLVTVSKTTFIGETLKLVGARNVFEDAPMKYPRPSPEEVILRNPDVLIICKLSDEGKEAERAKAYWMRFKNIKAVATGKVYVIPGDWLAKPGLPLIRGIQELRRIL